MYVTDRKSKIDILKEKIPHNFKLVSFSDLKDDVTSSLAIMGKVAKKSRKYSNPKRSWVKLELVPANCRNPEDGSTRLFAYFFNAFISTALSLKPGELVALAGFTVETVPFLKTEAEAATKNICFYQVLLSGPQCQVWRLPPEKKGYTYVTLQGILSHPHPDDQRFNCFAVLTNCQHKTSLGAGREYLELAVCDPSTSKKMEVAVYQRDSDDHFPPELVNGCIVRFHRLKLHRFPNGRILGKVFTPRDCLVFRKDDLTPISTAISYTLTDQDHIEAEKLQSWHRNHFCPFKKLCNLKSGEFADVICQVVRVSVLASGQCVVLRVWDGTLPLCGNGHHQTDSWEHEEWSDSLEEVANNWLCDVWAYDDQALCAAELHPEAVILLHNLHLHHHTGTYHLYMHGGRDFNRSIKALPPSSPQAQELLSQLRMVVDGMSSSSSHAEPSNNNDLSVVIQSCPETTAPVLSRRVEVCPHGPTVPGARPPFYSHQNVRVIEVNPLEPLAALWWYCSRCRFLKSYKRDSGFRICPYCPNNPLELTLLVVLVLADGDDCFEAFLWGSHASTFFHGLTPSLVLENPGRLEAMLSLLATGCPILDCCLLFYTSLISHSPRVQIHNTYLI